MKRNSAIMILSLNLAGQPSRIAITRLFLLALFGSIAGSAGAEGPDPGVGSAPAEVISCQAANRPGDLILLGDSISALTSAPYSKAVAKAALGAEGNGFVARYAVGGSAAKYWLLNLLGKTGPTNENTVCDSRAGLASPAVKAGEMLRFADIKAANPAARAFIIALGTNDIASFCRGMANVPPDKFDSVVARDSWIKGARQLAEAVAEGGARCIWVLPLTYTDGPYADLCAGVGLSFADVIHRYLQPAVSPFCATVDSNQNDASGAACAAPPTQDGIHPKRGAVAEALGTCVGKRVHSLLQPE